MSASPQVVLTSNGHTPVDDIVRLLRDEGAERITVDPRSGDSGAGVAGYFYIEFCDTGAGGAKRILFGFHANPNDQNERGWTRIQIGADTRGRRMLEGVALETGGHLWNQADGSTRDFEEPSPAPEMRC